MLGFHRGLHFEETKTAVLLAGGTANETVFVLSVVAGYMTPSRVRPAVAAKRRKNKFRGRVATTSISPARSLRVDKTRTPPPRSAARGGDEVGEKSHQFIHHLPSETRRGAAISCAEVLGNCRVKWSGRRGPKPAITNGGSSRATPVFQLVSGSSMDDVQHDATPCDLALGNWRAMSPLQDLRFPFRLEQRRHPRDSQKKQSPERGIAAAKC